MRLGLDCGFDLVGSLLLWQFGFRIWLWAGCVWFAFAVLIWLVVAMFVVGRFTRCFGLTSLVVCLGDLSLRAVGVWVCLLFSCVCYVLRLCGLTDEALLIVLLMALHLIVVFAVYLLIWL